MGIAKLRKVLEEGSAFCASLRRTPSFSSGLTGFPNTEQNDLRRLRQDPHHFLDHRLLIVAAVGVSVFGDISRPSKKSEQVKWNHEQARDGNLPPGRKWRESLPPAICIARFDKATIPCVPV